MVEVLGMSDECRPDFVAIGRQVIKESRPLLDRLAPNDLGQLCHRCRRVPMVTTVSDGAREVALCLKCLDCLTGDAIASVNYSNRHDDLKRAWREVLRTV